MYRFLLTILSYTSFLSVTIIAVIIVRSKKQEPGFTRAYLLIALFPVLWSIGYTFLFMTTNIDHARSFYELSALGWCLGPSASVYFVYKMYLQLKGMNENYFVSALLFLPYPFLLYGVFTRKLMATQLIKHSWGWIEVIDKSSLWVIFYSTLAFAALTLSVLFLILLWIKAHLNRHKLQIKIIIIPCIISSIPVFFTNLIFPILNFHAIPPVGHLFVGAWVTFIGIAIIKYPILSIKPEFVIDSIIMSMHDIMLLTDLSGIILDANPAIRQILGISVEELKTKPLGTIVPGHYIDKIFKLSGDDRLIQKNVSLAGTRAKIACSSVAQRIYDKFHDPVGYLILAQDIRKINRLNELTKKLRDKNLLLKQISITDSLTQIYNRKKINAEINNEIERHSRYQTKFAVILFDIDYFKAINDNYGHTIGDQVLIDITQTVKATIRSTDILARWGGEEFIILCPENTLVTAQNLAERIRQNIEQTTFKIREKLTASFGVTEVKTGDTLENIIIRSDKALYMAKNSGRNSVKIL